VCVCVSGCMDMGVHVCDSDCSIVLHCMCVCVRVCGCLSVCVCE
jgi:hypothetical protein